MKIELPCYGIIVDVEDGAGSISSDLHEELDHDIQDEKYHEDSLYNAMMDAIESMILAHACAGFDVSSPDYLEGIETAVQSCGANI